MQQPILIRLRLCWRNSYELCVGSYELIKRSKSPGFKTQGFWRNEEIWMSVNLFMKDEIIRNYIFIDLAASFILH